MKVLYDTSVLIAALLSGHSNHSVAFPSLRKAREGEIQGYLSTHSLAELYSVMTRLPEPLRVSPSDVQAVTSDLLKYVEAVPLLAEDYQAAIAQMVVLKLPGGGIFDALIAQAALRAKVDYLITLNPKDFTRLGEAIAILVKVPIEN
jgi:predicted nucleic acid-binding protein